MHLVTNKAAPSRPLGDDPSRSYASKLDRFAQFAETELRQLFRELSPAGDKATLDLGCGIGLATRWLADQVSGNSLVVGVDLSAPHLRHARQYYSGPLIQADVSNLCFRTRTVDFVWCCNTLNHVAEPALVLANVGKLLAPGGRIALAQSAILPDMYFAWDSHLEEQIRAACYAYYRDKYGLSWEDTTGIRGVIGLLQRAGFRDVRARTYVIERTQPLTSIDRAYFLETVFAGYWGTKLAPHASAEVRQALADLTDPASPSFCLNRPDFHHVQTLTVFQGAV